MVEDLNWFGISWDEGYQGPEEEAKIKIPYFSYIQSKRFPLYAAAWKILLDRGYIYPCSQSRRDVEAALSAPHDIIREKKGERPPELRKLVEEIPNESIFPVALRPKFVEGVPYGIGENSFLPEEFRIQKTPYERAINWRFRVPDDFRAIKFVDGQYGEQMFFPGEDFGDFLVWRVDGYPSYELAVIVDDILMGITEVVRGQDLLISTARQLLLMKAIFGLDYESPSHWHARPSSPLQLTPPSENVEDQIDNATEVEMEDKDRIADLFDTERHGYLLPVYFHLPLVCDEAGKRLAKRNMAKSLRTLRGEGQTPEALRAQYFQQQRPSV
jgi:glutamyl/glutaminyl-tRNA synthetase